MDWLVEQQQLQFAHDAKNHQDVHCLSRIDRIKHYGLHYAKYCGRLARDGFNDRVEKTFVDWFLVTLSASIALQDRLVGIERVNTSGFEASFTDLCEATGRFCDACEKIDHLEEFRSIAVPANRDLVALLLGVAKAFEKPIPDLLTERRRQLADRAFYSC